MRQRISIWLPSFLRPQKALSHFSIGNGSINYFNCRCRKKYAGKSFEQQCYALNFSEWDWPLFASQSSQVHQDQH